MTPLTVLEFDSVSVCLAPRFLKTRMGKLRPDREYVIVSPPFFQFIASCGPPCPRPLLGRGVLRKDSAFHSSRLFVRSRTKSRPAASCRLRAGPSALRARKILVDEAVHR